MNVLYLSWPCMASQYAIDTLEKDCGCNVFPFTHPDYELRYSDSFDETFQEFTASHHIDFCFSLNFFPLLAESCHLHGLKYISIVYDNPQVRLYSYRITYPTNYVFMFDSEEYENFKSNGINTVFYTVLPAKIEAYKKLTENGHFYDNERVSADISFVGSLYDEEHNLYDRMYQKLDAHTQGYLDGLLNAQHQIQGFDLIRPALTKNILDKIFAVEPYHPRQDSVESLDYIYASYFLERKLTSIERVRYLHLIGEHHPVKLFTLNRNRTFPGVTNMGTTDYYTEMPLVFHNSKINLNFSLRSIHAGVPLRCMDIIGAGGFLLTNYQKDLFRFFEPGKDFDYFEDEKDLLTKIDFYLSHEELRKEIAHNAYEKACNQYSYKAVFTRIFETAFQ